MIVHLVILILFACLVYDLGRALGSLTRRHKR